MHLAQINIGRLLYPLDDPRVADFVGNLDRVNALAEAGAGLVWRLKDETGNATQIAAYDDPTILTGRVGQGIRAQRGKSAVRRRNHLHAEGCGAAIADGLLVTAPGR